MGFFPALREGADDRGVGSLPRGSVQTISLAKAVDENHSSPEPPAVYWAARISWQSTSENSPSIAWRSASLATVNVVERVSAKVAVGAVITMVL